MTEPNTLHVEINIPFCFELSGDLTPIEIHDFKKEQLRLALTSYGRRAQGIAYNMIMMQYDEIQMSNAGAELDVIGNLIRGVSEAQELLDMEEVKISAIRQKAKEVIENQVAEIIDKKTAEIQRRTSPDKQINALASCLYNVLNGGDVSQEAKAAVTALIHNAETEAVFSTGEPHMIKDTFPLLLEQLDDSYARGLVHSLDSLLESKLFTEGDRNTFRVIRKISDEAAEQKKTTQADKSGGNLTARFQLCADISALLSRSDFPKNAQDSIWSDIADHGTDGLDANSPQNMYVMVFPETLDEIAKAALNGFTFSESPQDIGELQSRIMASPVLPEKLKERLSDLIDSDVAADDAQLPAAADTTPETAAQETEGAAATETSKEVLAMAAMLDYVLNDEDAPAEAYEACESILLEFANAIGHGLADNSIIVHAFPVLMDNLSKPFGRGLMTSLDAILGSSFFTEEQKDKLHTIGLSITMPHRVNTSVKKKRAPQTSESLDLSGIDKLDREQLATVISGVMRNKNLPPQLYDVLADELNELPPTPTTAQILYNLEQAGQNDQPSASD